MRIFFTETTAHQYGKKQTKNRTFYSITSHHKNSSFVIFVLFHETWIQSETFYWFRRCERKKISIACKTFCWVLRCEFKKKISIESETSCGIQRCEKIDWKRHLLLSSTMWNEKKNQLNASLSCWIRRWEKIAIERETFCRVRRFKIKNRDCKQNILLSSTMWRNNYWQIQRMFPSVNRMFWKLFL